MNPTKKRRKMLFIQRPELPIEVITTEVELKKAMRKIFKYHIGEDNSISPVELFEKLIGIYPYDLDVYKRYFWWNMIKKSITDLRSDGSLFIVNTQKLYVLQTLGECKKFNDKVERIKVGLTKMQKVAVDWVAKEKWKNL